MTKEHLEDIVYEDFTAGLWETNSTWRIPQGGLTELIDAFPAESGELTAGPVLVPVGSGSSIGSNRLVVGLGISGFHYTPPGYPNSTPARPRLLIATASTPWTTGSSMTIHYRDLDPDLGAVSPSLTDTWTLLRTHGSGIAPVGSSQGKVVYPPVNFINYRDTVTGLQAYYIVPGSNHSGSEPGVWRINSNPTSGTTVTRTSGPPASGTGHFILTHQDRLGAYILGPEHYVFTEPGNDVAFNEVLLVDASDPIRNIFAVSFFPDQLLVLRQPRGVYQVQGEVSDPQVRQIDESFPLNVLEWPAVTPYGLVYVSPHRGAALFTGEPPYTDISGPRFESNILGPFTSPDGSEDPDPEFVDERVGIRGTAASFYGQLAYGGDFVFTPEGYVYDFRTEAWFRMSLPTQPALFDRFLWWTYDKFNEVVYTVRSGPHLGSRPQVYAAQIGTNYQATYPAAAPTYSFTLAPIPLDSRRAEIEELIFQVSEVTPNLRITVQITGDGEDSPLKTITNPDYRIIRVPVRFSGRSASIRFTITDTAGGIAPDFQRLVVRLASRGSYKPQT